jgi:glycosyltransferase involved in cell wall biosynthesis
MQGTSLNAPTVEYPLELSVVMPCLNEARTVGICVEKAVRTMRELNINGEVVVVDNGSTDGSVEIAEKAGARVVCHGLKGYGNALRRGFTEARGKFIIMGDADDSYDFTDLGRFVEKLREGAELVMGNRFAGEIKPGAMPWLHKWFGNPVLSAIVKLLFRTRIGDSHCGMRGFRKDAVTRMNLQMPGMELASEMVIKSNLAGLKVEEIPITLWPDGRGRRPHLRSFRDGWRNLRFMLMCCPFFLFLIPGLFFLLLGLVAIPTSMLAGYGTADGFFGPNFLFTSSIMALAGWHIIVFGFLAKLHAHHVDPVFRDPKMDFLAKFFHLERGLILGGCLLLISLALGIPVFAHWLQTWQVPNPGQWIAAGTTFMLGLEMVFLSFLVSILDLSRESHRQG